MIIDLFTSFFMWCTIINTGLFAFWMLWLTLAPDLVYRTQRKWFPLSRESLEAVMYCFLGAFKIFLIFFNLTPLIALLIIR